MAGSGVAASSTNVPLNSGFESLCALFVRADDEDGVVACDGADDLGPVFIVDARGDWLGAAGVGDENDKVHRLTSFETKGAEDFANAGGRVVAIGRRRDGVAGGTFVEMEVVNVARESGLGDVEA